jgi:hypothetical protein
MAVAEKQPAFKISDLYWLLAIGLTMAGTGIWEFLSPRPEIGMVSVLWIPSAIMLVALVRNWGRYLFIFLAILVFYVVGGYKSFEDGSQFSYFSLLTADILEFSLIAFILVRWGSSRFQFTGTLAVAVYSTSLVLSCFLSSFLAAAVSQVQMGNMPIDPAAPLQVGVAWFTANLATYFLVATPLLTLTASNSRPAIEALLKTPIKAFVATLLVIALTFVGYFLPQYIALKTGLALGSGGLTLIAFPIATYLAIRRGSIIATLTGAAIGIPTIYATIGGIGPFGDGNTQANVFEMQATLIVVMFTLLLVGVMAEQLRERSRMLERSLEDAMKLRRSIE